MKLEIRRKVIGELSFVPLTVMADVLVTLRYEPEADEFYIEDLLPYVYDLLFAGECIGTGPPDDEDGLVEKDIRRLWREQLPGMKGEILAECRRRYQSERSLCERGI